MALTLDWLRERRPQILDLAAKYGASNIRVFGSVARGEAVTTSDVDLLVDFAKPGLFALGGFKDEVEHMLGVSVDVVKESAIQNAQIRDTVLRDAVAL